MTTDNKKERKPYDLTRIQIQEDWELDWWANELGATKEEVIDAVGTHGTSAITIREYIASMQQQSKIF
ncbi:MAG: DUF3606 domain-containing protein [Bacteroidota bacterium]